MSRGLGDVYKRQQREQAPGLGDAGDAGIDHHPRLARQRAALPDAPLVVSLDLRGGRVLSPQPEFHRLRAPEALERLARSGVREAIVLDLARVGSGAGPDVALVRELSARCPELELLAGGGVRDVADLRALAEAGAAGALVATALHSGAIGRDQLRALG